MTVSSAPGKVYLFGEHAVVYGQPAVPCAIDRRARVTVTPCDADRLRIETEDVPITGFAVEYHNNEGPQPELDAPADRIEATMAYVKRAVERARDVSDRPGSGMNVSVKSAIPIGAGLGSSAAVTVATIDATTRTLGTTLPPRELADQAYSVENEVQDGQASRADTFCSAMGGAVRIEGATCGTIETPPLPFIIGFDGCAGDTGELVARVRQLRSEYGFAGTTIETIGDLVREGEACIADDRLEELGRLMDFNHGLLSAIGVSTPALDAMVWAARSAGARGAKLTGAGGGGCILALAEDEAVLTALQAAPVCADAFRADLDRSGVRRGKPS